MYDCQTMTKLLYPYLDNELDVKEALRVQIHLDECARCRGLFEKERIFLEALREGFPAERAPASLRGRIREEIADEVPAGRPVSDGDHALAPGGAPLCGSPLSWQFSSSSARGDSSCFQNRRSTPRR
ncbi:MAG: zf-HC2 domain-containing protein [Candidatus Manganitrophus sp.]|nr:MAG: zf-HC2 domain-containing protein [Candidatus Manganitrophus sp.]